MSGSQPLAKAGSAARTWDEAARLQALDGYNILDTPREDEFDELAAIASSVLKAPIAVVNFIASGRQWFKAELGIGQRELPLDVSICRHAILQSGVFVVPDLTKDDRFDANPLVAAKGGLRFYAGALLETSDGLPLGTLCVLDTQPRPEGLSESERFTLSVLARQVMTQLELRKTLAQQRSSEERMHRILESAIDYGIIAMDLAGRVTSWNEGAHRILGWTEEEMRGRACDDFFTPEDRAAGIPEKEMGAALAHGRGSDERWHLRKDGTRFWASGEMMPLTDEANEPVGFLKILRDRTEARQAREALKASEEAAERGRRLLTNELEHRVKNTLALVQAIVSQSLRNAASPADARQAIEERLVSLARAHDILTSESWASAPISAIIRAATSVHGPSDRIDAEGPDFNVSARAAVNLSLALHELCTNAAKYGGLSDSRGRVQIRWSITGDGADARFELDWKESAGPPVLIPTRRGFGSRIIEASLSGAPDGVSTIQYLASGVEWRASVPLSAIEEIE